MGVYIKSMKMPKNCRTCKLIDYDRGCYRCIVTTAPCDLNSKNENCPLVPIPPHGRLIDADEFLKRAIGTKCFRGDYALMLEKLVGESTTIIPAEEGE